MDAWEKENPHVEALLHPRVRTLVSSRRQLATVRMALFSLTTFPFADIVETGVFHGGTTVLMARVLRNVSSERSLWACDSFQGLPRAQREDKGGNCSTLSTLGNSAVPRRSCGRGRVGMFYSPRTTVEAALRNENLTHHVRIVPGWFHESLPPAGLKHIGFLRLDGDTFNGTYEALRRLYPLVVIGGIVYLDDAGAFKGAAMALRAYFSLDIGTPILEEEGYYESIWWQKKGEHS